MYICFWRSIVQGSFSFSFSFCERWIHTRCSGFWTSKIIVQMPVLVFHLPTFVLPGKLSIVRHTYFCPKKYILMEQINEIYLCMDNCPENLATLTTTITNVHILFSVPVFHCLKNKVDNIQWQQLCDFIWWSFQNIFRLQTPTHICQRKWARASKN